MQLLATLGDADLARAADAAIAAEAASDTAARNEASAVYAAEFTAAVRQLSAALHEAAGLPALREAVAWQNRHALTTGIDVLVRRGPEPAKRNGQHRQHEALVASYLQRYCAKNDTIGFFGPVGWSQIDDGPGIRITHAASGRSAGRPRHLPGGLGSARDHGRSRHRAAPLARAAADAVRGRRRHAAAPAAGSTGAADASRGGGHAGVRRHP